MQYTLVHPFEEAETSQYFKKRKSRRQETGKTLSGQGKVTSIGLPTENFDCTELYYTDPAYTSTETVNTEGDVTMERMLEKWITTGAVMLGGLALSFLVSFLVVSLVPREVSIYGFLMSTVGAGIFAWESRVRRRTHKK